MVKRINNLLEDKEIRKLLENLTYIYKLFVHKPNKVNNTIVYLILFMIVDAIYYFSGMTYNG